MTWLPSRTGAVVDLVDPTPIEVDFPSIAYALADLNRFVGNAPRPVSVALHTLIGLSFVPAALAPWWLLHDAHEARLGDRATPVKDAARHVAALRYGRVFAEQFDTVFAVLESAHDAAIHAAAGLAMPTPEQREQIKQCDLVALATEKRWFCAECRLPWFHEVQGVKPHPVKPKWLPSDKAGDALLAAFRRHLPALKDKSGRAVA